MSGKKMFTAALALAAFAMAPMAATAGGDRPEVPMKGSMTSTASAFGAVPDDRCPTIGDAADTVSMFEGYGRATHLGGFTWSSTHCSDFDTGTYGDGYMVMVAANGDELHVTYDDGVVLDGPPVAPFMDHAMFVDGGTGRFARASGSTVEFGAFDFATGQIHIEFTGTIAYGR